MVTASINCCKYRGGTYAKKGNELLYLIYSQYKFDSKILTKRYYNLICNIVHNTIGQISSFNFPLRRRRFLSYLSLSLYKVQYFSKQHFFNKL